MLSCAKSCELRRRARGQTMKFLKENAWLRKAGMFLLDMVFVFISIYVSMELRFEMYIPVQHFQTLRSALPILVGCYMV